MTCFQKSWRKPRGIDNRVRRRYRGTVKMPKVGSKSARKTRHQLKNGFKKFLVRNSQDIELLLMNNRVFCAEIAQNISAKNR